MEGERARRSGLGNPYDEQHASAESDQIDEQREQLQFGQHIQILAVPRIPQMIFANGANPLRAFIQPPRRQTSPLLPEELCEKRGVLASEEMASPRNGRSPPAASSACPFDKSTSAFSPTGRRALARKK